MDDLEELVRPASDLAEKVVGLAIELLSFGGNEPERLSSNSLKQAKNGGGEIRTLGTPIRRTTVFET
jgi:hypothetical protein